MTTDDEESARTPREERKTGNEVTKISSSKMELATDQPRRTVNVHDASQIHLKNGSYR